MRSDVFAGPVIERDDPSTSWRSSKLAPSSTTRVRCIRQGQQLHVRSLQRQMRQPEFKETYRITYRRTFSLIGRSSSFPIHQLFRCGWTMQREAGARRLQSQLQHELLQRKRADVSMTTFEGAASCCYIITVLSSAFFQDFSQRLI